MRSRRMRGEAAGRGRECGRGRRAESVRGGAQPRGTERRSTKSSGEVTRLKGALLTFAGSEEPVALPGDGAAADRGRHRKDEAGVDPDDVTRELRWRLNRLETEKLELMASHNHQVRVLQGELVHWRAAVERGEAERAELQFRLSFAVSDAEQKRREQDQDVRNLRRELEERDEAVQSLTQDHVRLSALLTDQAQALEQSELRLKALQLEAELEAEREADTRRHHTKELRYLSDREERLRGDKEVAEQKVKALEANIEAERAAHLESKFNSEIIQLRLRDLEVALAVERSNQQEAACSTERLKEQLRESEKKREQEQRTSGKTLTRLHRLQEELERCKSDFGAALETEKRLTSSLRERLETETGKEESATARLQQATKEQSAARDAFIKFVEDTKETLQLHSAEDSGSWSPAQTLEKLQALLWAQRQRQEEVNKQIEDLLFASERLLDENEALTKLSAGQKAQIEDSEHLGEQLKQEVTRLQTEDSHWSQRCQALQEEAEHEREERKREREEAEVTLRAVREAHRQQEEEHVSSMLCLLQRLRPPDTAGGVSWDQLWVRVSERVQQMDTDLSLSEKQTSSLQRLVWRLEQRLRRREQDWSRKHRDAVAQLQRHLQVSRAEARSLQDNVASLTSDLSALCDQSARLQWACLLLGGALVHTQVRVLRLSEQKALLWRRLLRHEALEQELRSLWAALQVSEGAEGEAQRRSARQRWRRAFHALTALRRWSLLRRTGRALFILRVGGAGAVGVSLCGITTATAGASESGEKCIARWLRSKSLSSVVLSSMSDLQGALSGSSPHSVMSAAQAAMSRLLGHLLCQSAAEPASSLNGGLRRQRDVRPLQATELVSGLQRHFLDLSQRLHSAEVERRSLRLELNKVRRAAVKSLEELQRRVPSERFDAVCTELRGALCREHQAQGLVQEMTSGLMELKHKEHATTQETLNQTNQLLLEARREVVRKERSLRILGKHLCSIQKDRQKLQATPHGPQTAPELKDQTTVS